jgi:DNA-binding transcriptional MerR regulator
MHLELPTKRYYSIGEIAKAFDVNASLIRFWDKEFEALKPKKNAKGNRRFTPEDVQNLKLIYNLVKERGYTLEGAKTYLKEQDHKSLDNLKSKNNSSSEIYNHCETLLRFLFFTHVNCNWNSIKVIKRS